MSGADADLVVRIRSSFPCPKMPESRSALDDAMQALALLDARKSQVVEMRFFGGLTVQETADALGVSPETVMRDWQFAKKWLLRELSNRGER